MRSRFTKLGVTIAALASLAVGGSAIATAAQKGGSPTPTPPAVSAPAQAETPSATDGDTLQQGDQSGPDVAGAADAAEPAGAAEAPESAAAESASESSAASDGPGGHADPAGNVDNQQQGEN